VLDPRPRFLALAEPRLGKVNIPWDELADRVHELPAPGQTVLLRDDGYGQLAALRLTELRRLPVFVEVAPPVSQLWTPNPFLLAVIETLPSGKVVDLGCGVGREAVALRQRGWHVTAIDSLPDAITRGRDLESRYATNGPAIEWQVQKLADQPTGGPFDLAWMGYFYRPNLLRTAPEWLTAGGLFALEVFTADHFAQYGKPKNAPTVEQILASTTLTPISVWSGETAGRWTARIVLKRT
jgi:SAM-dependent methyltransferase